MRVVDWDEDEQPKQKVMDIIRITLSNALPESYDREVFNANKPADESLY